MIVGRRKEKERRRQKQGRASFSSSVSLSGRFPLSPHPLPTTHALRECPRKTKQQQDLDVAIIKATSSAAHVAPKEKHVATLKAAVGPQAPRARVTYVCQELRTRLRSATDWLVREIIGRG